MSTVEIVKGNLFESDCAAYVAPVNCVGTPGKALAAGFARRYKGWRQVYSAWCRQGAQPVPGRIHIHDRGLLSAPRWIISVTTKDHYRNPSRLVWIKNGAANLEQICPMFGIRSVAVPALGCGEGGLAWDDVRPILVSAAEKLALKGCRVVIFEPKDEAA